SLMTEGIVFRESSVHIDELVRVEERAAKLAQGRLSQELAGAAQLPGRRAPAQDAAEREDHAVVIACRLARDAGRQRPRRRDDVLGVEERERLRCRRAALAPGAAQARVGSVEGLEEGEAEVSPREDVDAAAHV